MKVADLHIYFKFSFACTCCKYRLPKANITPLGISLAPLAQISIYMYIISLVRFRSHFMCEYRLPFTANIEPLCGISLAPLAQISIYIKIPSSTADATAVRPLLGGAAPFSSRQRRATFPAIGKVYPTKLGKAERAKVGFGQLSTYGS